VYFNVILLSLRFGKRVFGVWGFKISSEQKANIDQKLDYQWGWDSFACSQRLCRLVFVVVREWIVAVLGCGKVMLSVR